MPLSTISIPFDRPLFLDHQVAYLGRGTDPVFYLHMARDPSRYPSARFGSMKKLYDERRNAYRAQFAGLFTEPMEVLISPSSRRDEETHFYRSSLAKKFTGAIDISSAVTRIPNSDQLGLALSADGASYDDQLKQLRYAASGSEPSWTSVVIVDDVLASGTTAALLIHKLREAGLAASCKITIACPLWLERGPSLIKIRLPT